MGDRVRVTLDEDDESEEDYEYGVVGDIRETVMYRVEFDDGDHSLLRRLDMCTEKEWGDERTRPEGAVVSGFEG